MKPSLRLILCTGSICCLLLLTVVSVVKIRNDSASLLTAYESTEIVSSRDVGFAEVLHPDEHALVKHWISHGTTTEENVAAANILGRVGVDTETSLQSRRAKSTASAHLQHKDRQNDGALILNPRLSSITEPYGIVISSWRSRSWESFCDPIRKLIRGGKRPQSLMASPVVLRITDSGTLGEILSRLVCAELFALIFGRQVQAIDLNFRDTFVVTSDAYSHVSNFTVKEDGKYVHVKSFHNFFLGDEQNYKKKELLGTILLVDSLGQPSEILPLLNTRIAKESGTSRTLDSAFKTEDVVLCTSLTMLQPPNATIHRIESSMEALITDVVPILMLGLAFPSFAAAVADKSMRTYLECAWQVSVLLHDKLDANSNTSILWMFASDDGIHDEDFFLSVRDFLVQKRSEANGMPGIRDHPQVDILCGTSDAMQQSDISQSEADKWYGYFLLRETHACVDTNSALSKMGCYASVRRHAFMESFSPVPQCLLYDNYY